MSSPPSPTRHRIGRATWIVLALLAAGFVVVVSVPSQAEAVTVVGLVFGNSFAGVSMYRRAQSLEERERTAWCLMGLAFVASAVGVTGGAVTALITGSIGAFSGFDIIILSAYLLLVAGLGSMPGSSGDWKERAQRLIDGTIVALAVGTLVGIFVLEDIIMNLADAPLFDRFVGSAYPLLDTVAIVSAGIVFVRRRHHRFDVRLIVLSLGLFIQAAADLSYLTTATGLSFAEASPNFAAFIAAPFFYVAAAGLTDRSPEVREVSDRRTPIWSLIAPYGAALVMLGVLSYEIFGHLHSHTGLLFANSMAVFVLVILRQALAIRENRILVERERTSLISSLSHELRTPLTSLVGFLSVLDDDGDLLTASERIDIIATTRQQADYMGRMVTDLVMLSRDDLDKIDLVRGAEMLDDVVERSLVSADIPRTNLSVDVRPKLMVNVDGDRLQQVLVNLLTNADRYGSGQITVTANVQRSDLFVSVHDNGAGIPKKHQVTMWDRFERAHHRFDASIPGSGIGLAIASSLAKAHGGRVTYRTSELLGGACFTVELPGVVVRAPALRPVESAREGTQAAAG